jgi:YD repeat-containing protein
MDIHDNGTIKDTTVYKYDGTNRLLEFYNNHGKNDEKFMYDSNDRLTEADYYLSGVQRSKFTLTYASSSPVEHSVLYTNGVATSSGDAILTLNSNGKVVKTDNGNNNYYLFTYDGNGNVVGESYYSVSNLSTPRVVYTFTFGSKKNQLSGAKGNFEILFVTPLSFVNDLLSTTTTDNSVNPANTSSNYNTFTYNADGYPTTETVSSTNAPSATNIHTYIYTTL